MRKLNERGMALTIVLLLIVLISIFGLTLFLTSSNSLKQVDNERTDQATYYIAEAGLNVVQVEVKKILVDAYTAIDGEATKFLTDNKTGTYDFEENYFKSVKNTLENKEFEVNNFTNIQGEETKSRIKVEFVSEEASTLNYRLISVGHIGSSSRNLSLPFSVKLNKDPSQSIISSEITTGSTSGGSTTGGFNVPENLKTDVIGTNSGSGVYISTRVSADRTNVDAYFHLKNTATISNNQNIPPLRSGNYSTWQNSTISLPSIIGASSSGSFQDFYNGETKQINSSSVKFTLKERTQNSNLQKYEYTITTNQNTTIYINTSINYNNALLELTVNGTGIVDIVFNNSVTAQHLSVLNPNATLQQLNVHMPSGYSINGDIKINGSLFLGTNTSNINQKLIIDRSLYYAGNGDFNYNGQSEAIVGNIYAPNATFNSNGKTCVVHQLVTNSLALQGTGFIVGKPTTAGICTALDSYAPPQTSTSTVINKGEHNITFTGQFEQ